ncbi:MAG: DUF4837 family protein [Paludibacteraceae bacterium]|nr:DUF4837 family protein [Paludibacteraceae bacterium]
MKRCYWILAIVGCILTGCKHGHGVTKVSASGSIYECLVVCPDAVYEPIQAVMEGDMPCLPQMEPYFNLTHVHEGEFDDFLKPTRNIIIIDIDSARYTGLKIKYSVDYWSKPQRVFRIQSPDPATFLTYWQANGEDVRDWLVRQELDRQASFYRANTNKAARASLQRNFHCDMLINEDYQTILDSVDFLWCCNNKGTMRRDIVVYSYPYTDVNTFTLDYLCHKRDSVLGQHITASVAGSYMGTEYRIFPPQMRQMKVQKDGFAYEVRGLWKIQNGEAMGGPFVSHTRLDEVNHRVITAEVFVYAAGQKKRNALRQAEAMLYTLQLEQELSALEDIEITGK